MKLALADAHAHVADGPLPPELLEPTHLARRRALVSPERALDPEPSRLPQGGTTYLCAVEAGADRRDEELILRHRVADRLLEIALELEIAVGDDADGALLARPRSGRRRS